MSRRSDSIRPMSEILSGFSWKNTNPATAVSTTEPPVIMGYMTEAGTLPALRSWSVYDMPLQSAYAARTTATGRILTFFAGDCDSVSVSAPFFFSLMSVIIRRMPESVPFAAFERNENDAVPLFA